MNIFLFLVSMFGKTRVLYNILKSLRKIAKMFKEDRFFEYFKHIDYI